VHLHLLTRILPRRRRIASDARIPPRLGVDSRLLLMLDRRAAYTTWLVKHLFLDSSLVATDGLLVVLFLLGLGHADEPVEREGGEDVEDAVGPEDTWLSY
jgi:hypothetical protein